MALSLGWHIVIACFGVALPIMIFVVHRRGVRRSDETALLLARRWSKVAAVLFAIGAVSGTILSFEMGILWPGLMGPYGDVIGLPFALEGLAFFTEAIFLGIYLYGWDRLPPKIHYRMLLPIAGAGVVGTFCILSVNAWMQAPTGFRLVDGKVTDVDPWAAMFNDAVVGQFAHMWVAAFMVVGFSVSAVYAVGMLRGRRDEHHRLGFLVPFAFASVAAVTQPFIGHLLGLQVGDRQPAKLAAFELSTETERQAPLRIGGLLVDGEVRGAIVIPRIGSLIATNSLDGEVPGLDAVPVDERPPVNLVHLSFQLMVGIGTALAAFAATFWIAWRRGHDWTTSTWFLRLASVSGILAVVALEAGWIATEVGRQPWLAYGVLLTRDAASSSSGLWYSYGVMVVVYSAMTIGAVVVLRSMAQRWREGAADLPTPYGPGPAPVPSGPREGTEA
ncbi:cytochrome ubiquinol oxidase subunit I [Aquihabitans sp. G128]|uniref:cytochrome ubiquinol oxidase subunit I n=1 Tax=Aquihabitans sp. G128 TaxID=2849779 RepID=UPI001C22B410|nr:cytochrome ubiquinol oxidase subunit I [Aquihabitans sp. G128]QXC60602.1 cytochrome ubiquinol oxidase subunit I [Aquihabitans sp. G128]